ncbi:hypothetical protein ACODNH_00810 (plasmid) [Haloarcula sp. NS06]|uniref:hypothetical protein n=1 Tax=Haloarcula sp. NS06 TaxID=3409688 RepID=UPI003DA7435C
MLTWGYAIGHGWPGLKVKLQAVFDGFSADVESVETDGRTLLSRLDDRIPADQLHSSQVIETAIQVANEVYKSNLSILKS